MSDIPKPRDSWNKFKKWRDDTYPPLGEKFRVSDAVLWEAYEAGQASRVAETRKLDDRPITRKDLYDLIFTNDVYGPDEE